MNLMDVYDGPAMRDLPRGSIKQLRVFTYHFAFQRQAGITHRVGADGPWEVKKVLGTVPVEEDGSAFFRIPAKTPISVQPLDADGRAVQLMRSWMTAMPGETLSCVGCHQQQRNTSPPNIATLALRHGAAEIQPWRGPNPRLQLQGRGPTGARQVLRGMPQRPTQPLCEAPSGKQRCLTPFWRFPIFAEIKASWSSIDAALRPR